jgi:hypothetical protein
MGKYELKTKVNDSSVTDFLNQIEDEKKREESFQLLDFFSKITDEEPKMWGGSIIGFGSYHYKYASGQEGDWMKVGFSPRKQKFSIYLMSGFEELQNHLNGLGKYKTGKGCLYVNKLADIDIDILEKMVLESFNHLRGEINN